MTDKLFQLWEYGRVVYIFRHLYSSRGYCRPDLHFSDQAAVQQEMANKPENINLDLQLACQAWRLGNLKAWS